MQVGSLVKRRGPVAAYDQPELLEAEICKMLIAANYRFPQLETIYTVRAVIKSSVSKKMLLLLEELNNPIIPLGFGITAEVGFEAKDFIEVQPPLDVYQLLKDDITNENTTVVKR